MHVYVSAMTYPWHSLPCDFAEVIFHWAMLARPCDLFWAVMWEEASVPYGSLGFKMLNLRGQGCSSAGRVKTQHAWSPGFDLQHTGNTKDEQTKQNRPAGVCSLTCTSAVPFRNSWSVFGLGEGTHTEQIQIRVQRGAEPRESCCLKQGHLLGPTWSNHLVTLKHESSVHWWKIWSLDDLLDSKSNRENVSEKDTRTGQGK